MNYLAANGSKGHMYNPTSWSELITFYSCKTFYWSHALSPHKCPSTMRCILELSMTKTCLRINWTFMTSANKLSPENRALVRGSVMTYIHMITGHILYIHALQSCTVMLNLPSVMQLYLAGLVCLCRCWLLDELQRDTQRSDSGRSTWLWIIQFVHVQHTALFCPSVHNATVWMWLCCMNGQSRLLISTVSCPVPCNIQHVQWCEWDVFVYCVGGIAGGCVVYIGCVLLPTHWFVRDVYKEMSSKWTLEVVCLWPGWCVRVTPWDVPYICPICPIWHCYAYFVRLCWCCWCVDVVDVLMSSAQPLAVFFLPGFCLCHTSIKLAFGEKKCQWCVYNHEQISKQVMTNSLVYPMHGRVVIYSYNTCVITVRLLYSSDSQQRYVGYHFMSCPLCCICCCHHGRDKNKEGRKLSTCILIRCQSKQ